MQSKKEKKGAPIYIYIVVSLRELKTEEQNRIYKSSSVSAYLLHHGTHRPHRRRVGAGSSSRLVGLVLLFRAGRGFVGAGRSAVLIVGVIVPGGAFVRDAVVVVRVVVVVVAAAVGFGRRPRKEVLHGLLALGRGGRRSLLFRHGGRMDGWMDGVAVVMEQRLLTNGERK